MYSKFSLCLLISILIVPTGCNANRTAQPETAGSSPTKSKAIADEQAESALASTQKEAGHTMIDKSIFELPADDRKEASQQKYCAIQTSNLLGSMGKPVKVMLNGQPVFLCCAGCKGKASRNPEETLAKVAELKARNATPE